MPWLNKQGAREVSDQIIPLPADEPALVDKLSAEEAKRLKLKC